jgi:Uma2 family endonuclease
MLDDTMQNLRSSRHGDRAVPATFKAALRLSLLKSSGTADASDDATMRRVDTVRPRVSYADLQRMPEDGNRYELYDGELHVVPSPLPIHQVVALRLYEQLTAFARPAGGMVFVAPFDIVLSEFYVVQPDVIYFGAELARRINLRTHVRFTPDLAIEVLSPSTSGNDRGRKRDLMARFGVPEYWIVDPDSHQIEVSVLRVGTYGVAQVAGGDRCKSGTVAGLEIDLVELFRDLD